MDKKPFVIIKCAVSLDGYLDDLSNERLILSNKEDFDKVDVIRAECDAIFVGAETIRKDNPKLLVRSEKRKKQRLEKGFSESPIKVTITSSGNLSSEYNFFKMGNVNRIVFCNKNKTKNLKKKLSDVAEIVECPSFATNLQFMLDYLYQKGIRKLLIEGGSRIITSFIENNLVDELQVSIAPFFVGEKKAPQFMKAGVFKYNKNSRMILKGVEKIGDVAMLTYNFSDNTNFIK